MDVLVLLKQVPDTETTIKIDSNRINESGIKWIISPYDEVALEEAIRTKEKSAGTVTVISVGPARVASSIRTAYAMGADHGIHILAENYEMLDASAISEALIKATSDKNYDLVLAGRQGIDSDSGLIPLMYAEKKGMAAIIWAKSIELDGDNVKAVVEAEGGEATYEAKLPVLITTQIGMNEPRYPSLKGIMASKKTPVETKNIDELGVSFSDHIEILGFEMPPARPAGRFIEGDETPAKAKELVKALHEEAKVI
ncbi:MAG: electron transfer flavoprotein subunit beta/FixA family protein [Leptospirales bacterium]